MIILYVYIYHSFNSFTHLSFFHNNNNYSQGEGLGERGSDVKKLSDYIFAFTFIYYSMNISIYIYITK
jgi:hypothetical protein